MHPWAACFSEEYNYSRDSYSKNWYNRTLSKSRHLESLENKDGCDNQSHINQSVHNLNASPPWYLLRLQLMDSICGHPQLLPYLINTVATQPVPRFRWSAINNTDQKRNERPSSSKTPNTQKKSSISFRWCDEFEQQKNWKFWKTNAADIKNVVGICSLKPLATERPSAALPWLTFK